MKKITNTVIACAIACVVCMSWSCGIFKNHTNDKPAQPVVDTTTVQSGPKKVPGVSGILVLHPVENAVKGGGNQTLHLLHDYHKGYIYVVDNDEAYPEISNFLQDSISKDSVIHSVEMGNVTAYPFVSFRDTTIGIISKAQGTDFSEINDYNIGAAFDVKEKENSKDAITLLLKMLKGDSTLAPSGNGGSYVSGALATLDSYPIKAPVKGIDNKMYYLFYSNGYIYVTDDSNLYDEIKEVLPLNNNGKNVVLIQGISIKPFVYFNKPTIAQLTKNQSFNADGKKIEDNGYNGWQWASISGHTAVFDKEAVMKELQNRLDSIAKVENPQAAQVNKVTTTTITKKSATKPITKPVPATVAPTANAHGTLYVPKKTN